MAKIKNPVTVCGSGSANPTLTVVSTIINPSAVKAYLNSVLPSILGTTSGKYYALNRSDWTTGHTYLLRMFTVNNGAVSSDAAVRVSTDGTLSARAWVSDGNLVVNAGDVIEFIPATE